MPSRGVGEFQNRGLPWAAANSRESLRRWGHDMKNIIIGAIAAAIAAGTLISAPLAGAAPTTDPTRDVTEDGPFAGPFTFPVEFPRLMREPTYGPRGTSIGVRSVRTVHSAYSIPASNPTA